MTENRKQPCRVCKEPIQIGALICNVCKSRQDWRRHVTVSSSVLSLLVALVSVTGIAIDDIVAALRSKKSDIRVTVIRTREHETVRNYLPDRKFDIQLYVANVGYRRGAIGRVQMKSVDPSGKWEDLDFTPHYAGSMDEMIEPGTANFLYYSRASLYADGFLCDRRLPEKIELKVEVINEDASRHDVPITVITGANVEKHEQ